MLRIQQQTSSIAARSYYRGRGEYYLGISQELPATWGGKGAAMLGLAGEVGRAEFDALCDNRTPDGGRLTARDRAGRTVGYDFNFHCPKSLSLLFCLNGDAAILAAFRSALAATLEEMEAAMQTRVRKGGAMADRTTGNMLWGEHIHLTARPVEGVPDPHLHAHAFVFNATLDPVERQWKASKNADIYRDAPYYQAVFHAHLAKALTDRGYPLERTKTGWEVAGLAGLLPKFSRRTEEIERVAAERGITDAAEKDRIGAATRGRKRDDLSMAELRRLWLTRLDDGERLALAASAAKRGTPSPAVSLDQVVAAAIEHGFAKGHASVPETRLVASALAGCTLTEGLGTLTADQIRHRLPAHGMVPRDYDGRRFWARRDPRSQPTAAELHRLAGIPPQRTDIDPERQRFGGMTRAEYDACTSRGAVHYLADAELPPGLADRQRSDAFLDQHRRRMIQEAEEQHAFEPAPEPSPRAAHGR